MNAMIHVRNFIQRLDLGQLVSDGIIPPTESIKPLFYGGIGQYPKWCNKKNMGVQMHSHHGMYMEWVIHKMCQSIHPDLQLHDPYFQNTLLQYAESKNDYTMIEDYANFCHPSVEWRRTTTHLSILKLTATMYSNEIKMRKRDIKKDEGFPKRMQKIYDWLLTVAEEFDSKPLFGQEYNCFKITSHPDLIWGDTVIDIKTTHNFIKMAPQSLLQILTYYTIIQILLDPETMLTKCVSDPQLREAMHGMILEQTLGLDLEPLRKIKKMAILLPLQRKLLSVDLSDWDASKFASVLLFQKKKYIWQGDHHHYHPNVGFHTNRQPTLLKTITDYYKDKPVTRAVQFFTRGNQGYQEVSFTKKDYTDTHKYVQDKGARVFIHSPYSINLSQPFNKWSKGKDTKDSWCIKLLLEELKIGHRIASQGVVVHTGKANSKEYRSDVPTATGRMRDSILYILDKLFFKGYKTPLLVETPAGQGSEILTDLKSLSEFYWSIVCRQFPAYSSVEKVMKRFCKKTGYDKELAKKYLEHVKARETYDWRQLFKICIDTCHVWSAGHDPVIYINQWIETCGADSIGLVHFNDCSVPQGSCRDLHSGQGFVGFRRMHQIIDICTQHGIPMTVE